MSSKSKNKEIKRSLIKGSFWSFIATITNRFGVLLLTIFLARLLMPEQFGLYSIVLSTSMIAYTITDLGLNKALTRYVADALANNKKKISSYYSYLFKLKFIVTSIASVALALLAFPLAKYAFGDMRLMWPFVFSAVYIFVLSFEGFYVQLFYAVGRVDYVSRREALSFILKVALLLAVFFILKTENYLSGLFIIMALSYVLLLAFNYIYSRKLIPEIAHKPESKIDKSRINSFITSLTIASISAAMFSHVDSIILGLFVNPEFVGFYRAAFSLIFGILGFIAFPNLMILPFFTKLNKNDTQAVFNSAFKYMTMISVPSMFALWVLGMEFIDILYGSGYELSILPLYILAVLVFPLTGVGLLTSLFSSKEKPQIFAKILMFIFVLNLILNFAFILIALSFGGDLEAVCGAALATTLSWIIYFILSFRATGKTLNLKVKFPPFVKPLLASLVMSSVILYVKGLFSNFGIIALLLEIILGLCVYLISLYLLGGISKHDFEMVKMLKSSKRL